MPRSIFSLSAKELAPDILILLNLYKETKLHEAVVRQVLKGACWWVSNAQGRRDACDLWSKEALKLREGNDAWHGLGLVHEHMIPRNVIEDEILALPNPTVEQIEELLKLSRVCVVTEAEDERLRDLKLGSRLPNGERTTSGGKERYQLAGIELSEIPFTSGKVDGGAQAASGCSAQDSD